MKKVTINVTEEKEVFSINVPFGTLIGINNSDHTITVRESKRTGYICIFNIYKDILKGLGNYVKDDISVNYIIYLKSPIYIKKTNTETESKYTFFVRETTTKEITSSVEGIEECLKIFNDCIVETSLL